MHADIADKTGKVAEVEDDNFDGIWGHPFHQTQVTLQVKQRPKPTRVRNREAENKRK